MLRSKEISDFMEVSLEQIRPETPTPTDLHLFMKANNHLILWRRTGTSFTPESLTQYKEKGLSSVWIHHSDWPQFLDYLQASLGETVIRSEPQQTEAFLVPAVPEENQASTLVSSPKQPSTQVSQVSGDQPPFEPVSAVVPQTPLKEASTTPQVSYEPSIRGQDFTAILRDPSKGEREKRAFIAKSARKLLGELASPTDAVTQEYVTREIHKTLHDFIQSLQTEESSLTQEIWSLLSHEKNLNHAMNVATYALLFALAFGTIEDPVLIQIALASTLHDIGIAFLPVSIAQTPWQDLTLSEKNEYLRHVPKTAQLLSSYSTELAQTLAPIINFHHETHSDLINKEASGRSAMLVALGDQVDRLCNGLWDGVTRTFSEAIDQLEEQELRAGDHGTFNPEMFSALLRWTRAHVLESPPKAA